MRHRRLHGVLPHQVVQDWVEVQLDFLDGVLHVLRHDFEYHFHEFVGVQPVVVLLMGNS